MCTDGSNEYSASIFRAEVVGVKIQFDFCCSHIVCSRLLLALNVFPLPSPPDDLTDHNPYSVSVYSKHSIIIFILNLKMEAE